MISSAAPVQEGVKAVAGYWPYGVVKHPVASAIFPIAPMFCGLIDPIDCSGEYDSILEFESKFGLEDCA